MCACIWTSAAPPRVMHNSRVESGSDDPDNVGHLGHFFEGSSGSHPQTNLSGCDPDFLVH